MRIEHLLGLANTHATVTPPSDPKRRETIAWHTPAVRFNEFVATAA